MNISTVNTPVVDNVKITADDLSVSVSDGRVVSVPVSWYPCLSHAIPQHLTEWTLIGGGHGIHWKELDEDISVENILFGQPSGESGKSFKKWKDWFHKKVTCLWRNLTYTKFN